MVKDLERLVELINESDARKDEEIAQLVALTKDLLNAGNECSKAPHYITQPFMNIVKEHQRTILKHDLFSLVIICFRCDKVVKHYQSSLCLGGEVVHTSCVMGEKDMDDFNGCND